jgi:hypothetical protein
MTSLGRHDRITLGERIRCTGNRIRGWVLCRIGRHLWAHHRNPEVGGPGAVYELCRRCRRERNTYDPPHGGGMGNAWK